MKREKGAITLYVTIVCLFVLTIGISVYIGVSSKQTAQLALLDKIEQEYQTSEQVEEDLYKQFLGGDIVPVYTPEQFEKVGTGEQIYVEQTGKIYTFGTDQTYMFYGITEDLTATIRSELKTQLTEDIRLEIEEEGIKAIPEKAQEPEAPRLASNMVAVYWSKDGGATASVHEEGASPIYSKIDANGNPSSTGTDNPNFIESNWYEYVAGYNLVDTRTSRWANGVTDDGSYWVWIPRFKYKITDKPGVAGEYSAGTVNVKFITVEENSGTEGYVTKNKNGEFITEDEEGYIIHPAFEDGSSDSAKSQGHSDFVEFNNGEWDSELAGFWIAKYEISAVNAIGSKIDPESSEISETIIMISKANCITWRNIYAGMCYKNCYNYNRENESHLIKLSEWGAVAYLTQSKYGRNGNEVTKNGAYTTATGGENASTTGNIYGVYDMNGGTWEITSAWDTLSTSGYLTSYGNVTIDGYSFGVSGGKSNKYATAYKNGTSTEKGDIVKTVCKTRRCNKRNFCQWYIGLV